MSKKINTFDEFVNESAFNIFKNSFKEFFNILGGTYKDMFNTIGVSDMKSAIKDVGKNLKAAKVKDIEPAKVLEIRHNLGYDVDDDEIQYDLSAQKKLVYWMDRNSTKEECIGILSYFSMLRTIDDGWYEIVNRLPNVINNK
jgi:hypothetical protein